MESDKPGLLMRRMLLELLQGAGEEEVFRQETQIPVHKLATRSAGQ
jgi:hypothetical protein